MEPFHTLTWSLVDSAPLGCWLEDPSVCCQVGQRKTSCQPQLASSVLGGHVEYETQRLCVAGCCRDIPSLCCLICFRIKSLGAAHTSWKSCEQQARVWLPEMGEHWGHFRGCPPQFAFWPSKIHIPFRCKIHSPSPQDPQSPIPFLHQPEVHNLTL